MQSFFPFLVRRFQFWLAAAILATGAVSVSAAPFLWEVEKDGRTSHLMGTVHSSHPLVRDIPPAVMESLHGSTAFLPELELSYENIGRMLAAAFDFEGSQWQERLPEELHPRLREAARAAGIPEFMLRNLSFEMIPFLLAQPPGENFAEVMDVQLYRAATQYGIEVTALETLEEQLAIFANLDDEAIIEMVKEALDEAENGYPAFRRLIEAYASGDEDEVFELMRELKDTMPDPFREALFDRRNELMAERARPHLREGGAFVAVGLGHLLGDNSIIALLREEGYAVWRVRHE